MINIKPPTEENDDKDNGHEEEQEQGEGEGKERGDLHCGLSCSCVELAKTSRMLGLTEKNKEDNINDKTRQDGRRQQHKTSTTTLDKG